MLEKWFINVLLSGKPRLCTVSCSDIVYICGAKVVEDNLFYIDNTGKLWIDAKPMRYRKGDK